MTKGVKLIVSDLDGTLLDDHKNLPSELPEILEALGRIGISFVAASGRQFYNIRKQFEPSGYSDKLDYIAENGGITGSGSEIHFCDEIDREMLARIIIRCRETEGCWPILCGKKAAYYEDGFEEMRFNTEMYYTSNRLVDDLLAVLEEDVFCKIAVYARGDAEFTAYPALLPFADEMGVSLSGDSWVDVMNKHTTKANALKVLLKEKNIDASEVMAFGDYLNDLEMLELCGHSYAMENGHELLRSRGFGNGGNNNEDGVTRTIRREILGE